MTWHQQRNPKRKDAKFSSVSSRAERCVWLALRITLCHTKLITCCAEKTQAPRTDLIHSKIRDIMPSVTFDGQFGQLNPMYPAVRAVHTAHAA
jgi:hypothetical protein